MAKTIEEILGGVQMSGVIKTVQTGLPRAFPDSFYKVTNKVVGNKTTYPKVTGERRHARTTNYGAPAHMVSGVGITEVGLTLMHSFEQLNMDPLRLQGLMGLNGGPAQDIAIEEIDRQSREFKQRFENLRTNAIASIFTQNGKIYLDGSGNLLMSSSGAVNTIDFGIPANNLNQANGVITVPWSSATADIIGNITSIKKTHVQNGKAPLRHAFYGGNITSHIAGNTNAKALIQQTPALAAAYYNSGEIPTGLGGLEWHPIYPSYGLNTSGTVTGWAGDDALILTPEPSSDWWRVYEGSYLVPRNLGSVNADIVAAARELDQVYGMFAYATLSHNPVTITQFAGDVFMPALSDPSSVWVLDTTP